MRLKAYGGHFKNDTFKELVRIDLGKYNKTGYIGDWYVYPVGSAVTLETEHHDRIVEDRLGNTLKAIAAHHIVAAMQDDNDEAADDIWTWEIDALEDPGVTHVVLAAW